MVVIKKAEDREKYEEPKTALDIPVYPEEMVVRLLDIVHYEEGERGAFGRAALVVEDEEGVENEISYTDTSVIGRQILNLPRDYLGKVVGLSKEVRTGAQGDYYVLLIRQASEDELVG